MDRLSSSRMTLVISALYSSLFRALPQAADRCNFTMACCFQPRCLRKGTNTGASEAAEHRSSPPCYFRSAPGRGPFSLYRFLSTSEFFYMIPVPRCFRGPFSALSIPVITDLGDWGLILSSRRDLQNRTVHINARNCQILEPSSSFAHSLLNIAVRDGKAQLSYEIARHFVEMSQTFVILSL